MKEQEFNLNEKRFVDSRYDDHLFKMEDVKEFIKIFNEFLEDAKEWNFHDLGLLEDIIRKFNGLAGEKLE